MPKRSADYMSDRRDQILDAVHACCRTLGWHRTTMRDVAVEAGVSKGGLYVHFPTKLDLLEGLLRRDLARVDAVGKLATPTEFIASVQEQISELAGAAGHIEAVSQNERYLDGLRNPRLKPMIEEGVQAAHSVVVNLIGRFCPHMSEDERSDRALAIMFFLEGVRSTIALSPHVSFEQLERVVARQLAALLSAEQSAPRLANAGDTKD